MPRDLFRVGDCCLCTEAIESDDGAVNGILIQRHRDGEVEVSHTACVAKEMGLSVQRADENRPLGYMTDRQAAAYIDGLMEAAYAAENH